MVLSAVFSRRSIEVVSSVVAASREGHHEAGGTAGSKGVHVSPAPRGEETADAEDRGVGECALKIGLELFSSGRAEVERGLTVGGVGQPAWTLGVGRRPEDEPIGRLIVPGSDVGAGQFNACVGSQPHHKIARAGQRAWGLFAVHHAGEEQHCGAHLLRCVQRSIEREGLHGQQDRELLAWTSGSITTRSPRRTGCRPEDPSPPASRPAEPSNPPVCRWQGR